MDSVLEGLSIIVTRPESQARSLIEKLNTLGAQTTAFPTVEIKPINDSPEFLKTIDCIGDTDIIIFISRNAVKHTLPLIKQQHASLPEHLKIVAVGPGTAEEIKALDVEVDLMPDDHYNTDGLLALKALIESTGKHIIIARGEGGKERLAETLTKRGAHVTYLESYRRALPKNDISITLKAQPDLIIATSNDVLQNLYDMTPESLREALLDCQLLVISPSMVEQCEILGFSHPAIVATNASDESIIKALL
jgi:uroporphyrinogen-III synthase